MAQAKKAWRLERTRLRATGPLSPSITASRSATTRREMSARAKRCSGLAWWRRWRRNFSEGPRLHRGLAQAEIALDFGTKVFGTGDRRSDWISAPCDKAK